MLKHADVLRFVVSLLPSALERGTAHRALISFNTVIILELLGRPTKTALNEGSLATLIPALTAPFTFSLAQQATAVHRDAMVSETREVNACYANNFAVGWIIYAPSCSFSKN